MRRVMVQKAFIAHEIDAMTDNCRKVITRCNQSVGTPYQIVTSHYVTGMKGVIVRCSRCLAKKEHPDA